MSLFNKTPLEQFLTSKKHTTFERNEYARCAAIGFARWLSGEGYQQYDEADRWICPSNNNNVYTTEQLYNQYLKLCSKT